MLTAFTTSISAWLLVAFHRATPKQALLLLPTTPITLCMLCNLVGMNMFVSCYAGCIKMTMPTAFTTSMLAWSLLAFPQGYSKAESIATAQNTIKWGTDYLLKTWRNAPAANVNSTAGVEIIYQV